MLFVDSPSSLPQHPVGPAQYNYSDHTGIIPKIHYCNMDIKLASLGPIFPGQFSDGWSLSLFALFHEAGVNRITVVNIPMIICFTLKSVASLQSPPSPKKIKIWPINALLEVLWFTTFSIYLVFPFEWHSYFSDTLIWVIFTFELNSNFSDIAIWETFKFGWHSNLGDIQIWMTFHF